MIKRKAFVDGKRVELRGETLAEIRAKLLGLQPDANVSGHRKEEK